MADLVINERRREARRPVLAQSDGPEPQVPGARVVEIIDTSPHGSTFDVYVPQRCA